MVQPTLCDRIIVLESSVNITSAAKEFVFRSALVWFVNSDRVSAACMRLQLSYIYLKK
jgi:hypothetical protein